MTVQSDLNDVMIEIATFLTGYRPTSRLRVAIDGVDGVGKTTFADNLAQALAPHRAVIRTSVDGFHHPRAVRYRLGKDSPQGFYAHSYDYQTLARVLLDPFGPGGSGQYRAAVFDHRTDASADTDWQKADPNAVLILDGIFLHRPELRSLWDFSIFLDAPFDVTIPRGAARGPDFGSPDPLAPSNARYVQGQRIYLSEEPQRYANVVIDYADVKTPRIVSRRWPS